MADGNVDLRRSLRRELAAVERRERRLERRAPGQKSPGWSSALRGRIPPKAAEGLEAAFARGLALLFERGGAWIERGCRPEEMAALYGVRNTAVDLRGGRTQFRRLYGGARRSNALNTALSAAEGLALGLLGVGLPDIVLFLGLLLRGIYGTAMSYGFECSSRGEQLLILRIMRSALGSGEERRQLGGEISSLAGGPAPEPDDAAFDAQLGATASALAVDMLVTKFIQGLPVVGVIGGAANPVYYRKITGYAELIYRKRYLLRKLETLR